MNKEIRDAAHRFLKTEYFYVTVLVLVALVGAWATYRAFWPDQQTSARPRLEPMDQKIAFRQADLRDTIMMRRSAQKMAFRVAVQQMNVLLLVAGTVLFFPLAAVFVLRRGRMLTPTEARAPVWGLWDVLKLTAFFAAGTTALEWVLVPPTAIALLTRGEWLAQIFGRILLIGSIIFVVREDRGGRLADLGFRGRFLYGVGVGLLAFVALQPVFQGIQAAQLRWADKLPAQDLLQALLTTNDPGVLLLGAVLALAVTPLAEELLFRGFLQPAVERWFGGGYAILITALFFAAAHMDLYALPQMLVLGLTLGYVYNRTRSLVAPVVLHTAHNTVVLLTFLSLRYTAF